MFVSSLKLVYVARVVDAVIPAPLEAEISEVRLHGPSHHLGSNGQIATARDFLTPLADIVDRQPTLRRYDLVLHLLQKPAFERGARQYQDADLLVCVGNELVHYKSKWGEQMGGAKVFSRLEPLGFDKPRPVSSS